MRSCAPALALVLLVSPLVAQGYREYRAPSFRDFGLVRARPWPFARALTLRAGIGSDMAATKDESLGMENETAFDGFAWYRDDHLGDRDAQVDVYAGRDGALIGIRDGRKDESGGRLELSSRFFPFWREGFYSGDKWVPTGRYEGKDYGAYLGLAAPLAEGFSGELGPFYRHYDFKRNSDTAPTYTLPPDFDAYGGRAMIQHDTLNFDSRTHRVTDGFLFAGRIEYERNNANDAFGTAIWTSTLPKAFWRGTAHLEWYFPIDGGSVWELQVDGGMSDRSDRVYNYDTEKALGNLWVDASLGYRLDLGSAALTPSGRIQYTSTVDESGGNNDNNWWIGAGVHLDVPLGDSFSLIADYSYLNNPNRPSVSYDRDVAGEHQFFVGMEARLGMSRR